MPLCNSTLDQVSHLTLSPRDYTQDSLMAMSPAPDMAMTDAGTVLVLLFHSVGSTQ